MAGFGELVSSVRWWTLIPGCWDRFLSSPVSADIRMWERHNYCSTGRQPANWRSDAGYLRSHGVPLRALFGPICGAILLWLAPGW